MMGLVPAEGRVFSYPHLPLPSFTHLYLAHRIGRNTAEFSSEQFHVSLSNFIWLFYSLWMFVFLFCLVFLSLLGGKGRQGKQATTVTQKTIFAENFTKVRTIFDGSSLVRSFTFPSLQTALSFTS